MGGLALGRGRWRQRTAPERCRTVARRAGEQSVARDLLFTEHSSIQFSEESKSKGLRLEARAVYKERLSEATKFWIGIQKSARQKQIHRAKSIERRAKSQGPPGPWLLALCPFAYSNFPVRRLYAAYANFLRLILSCSRSVNDLAVFSSEAHSSITAGIDAKSAHAARVALRAVPKASSAPA